MMFIYITLFSSFTFVYLQLQPAFLVAPLSRIPCFPRLLYVSVDNRARINTKIGIRKGKIIDPHNPKL